MSQQSRKRSIRIINIDRRVLTAWLHDVLHVVKVALVVVRFFIFSALVVGLLEVNLRHVRRTIRSCLPCYAITSRIWRLSIISEVVSHSNMIGSDRCPQLAYPLLSDSYISVWRICIPDILFICSHILVAHSLLLLDERSISKQRYILSNLSAYFFWCLRNPLRFIPEPLLDTCYRNLLVFIDILICVL